MAPEILKNQKYGKEVDVWSLGVIFYILLCGYPPFHDSNQAQLFEQIKAGQYEFDPEDWASISDGAKDLITHILVVDPRKRYTTQQILAHPWVVGKVSDAPLPGTIGQLKIFNARRKLKAGMNAVRTMVRVRMMTAALVRAVAQCGFFAVCGRVAVWPCGRVAVCVVQCLIVSLPRFGAVCCRAQRRRRRRRRRRRAKQKKLVQKVQHRLARRRRLVPGRGLPHFRRQSPTP